MTWIQHTYLGAAAAATKALQAGLCSSQCSCWQALQQ